MSLPNEKVCGVAIDEESVLVCGHFKHAFKCMASYVPAAWNFRKAYSHPCDLHDFQPMGSVTFLVQNSRREVYHSLDWLRSPPRKDRRFWVDLFFLLDLISRHMSSLYGTFAMAYADMRYYGCSPVHICACLFIPLPSGFDLHLQQGHRDPQSPWHLHHVQVNSSGCTYILHGTPVKQVCIVS